MNARIVLAAITVVTLAAVGCAPSTKSGRGFHMPAGDAEKGKAAFVQLKCYRCHQVDGVDLPAPTANAGSVLTLGGEVSRRRTYGDLVTAIIHPQRDLSDKLPAGQRTPVRESPMPGVNNEMTVAQLVDIVTFLELHYRELVPLYPSPEM
jgi:sulfur-oxidizing protein SoxX